MTTAVSETAFKRHSAWNIWGNPIFRRYCQSRLRVRGLSVYVLVTVLIAAFIVALATTSSSHFKLTSSDAARTPIIPLLVFQDLILFILGTAQVAGGITAERDEGVIDYQRLIPMSPLAKVLGYLFGLPIREYCMFLATVPFTIYSIWLGGISWHVWLPLYAAVLSSALLYHMTGLVTGTVVRNRRWAFLVSIGLVFALYTVIPQMARFGLVFFKYLTIFPVLEECLPGLLPLEAGKALAMVKSLDPEATFFNLNLPEVAFTLFSQGGLIVTFLIMLCRKWRKIESHLLGKLWATGFFIWVQVLLLGNALPLVDSGNLFPSHGLTKYAAVKRLWAPTGTETVAMCAMYGLVTLGLLFVLAGIITPSSETQLRGWRRTRKIGASSLAFLEDAATSFWFVLTMAIAGGVGWYLFTQALVESRWFPGHVVPTQTLIYFGAVMLTGGLAFQALLEAKGGRVVGLTAIFVGAVPVMLGIVLANIRGLIPVASWISGISPLSMPFYACASLLSLTPLTEETVRVVPRAFYFWLFVGGLVTIWLVVKLRAARKQIALVTAEAKAVA
jgi:hypothetical protein